MQILSALPGRVRWHVPRLRDNRPLSQSLTADLHTHPDVRRADANALTGNVLIEFLRTRSISEAQAWLEEALSRALVAPQTALEKAAPIAAADPLARLLSRTQTHRSLVGRTLGASFVNRLLDSAPPIMVGVGIDLATRGSSSLLVRLGLRGVKSQLLGLGGFGLAVWAIDALLDYVHRSSAGALADLVRNDLRNELYVHLQQLDVAQIEAQEISAWVSLLEGDLSQIHAFIKDGSDPIVTIVANSVAVAATFLTLSPILALAQVLLVPPVLIASKELLGPLKQRLIDAQRDNARMSAIIHGNISGLTTINSFAAQDIEARHVAEAGVAEIRSAQAATELSARYVPALTMIVGTGFMASLVYGVTQVRNGTLSPGGYNVVGSSQLRLLAAIGYFGTSLESYQRTSLSLQRVFSTLDLKPTISSPPRAVPIQTLQHDIALDNVTFGYDLDRKVFRNLRVLFPAGRTVGIVGSSGAGKSTLLKLLLRFYDVQDGAVRFDGVDVRDLQLDDLRSTIAMVSQDVAVFAGTIAYNIAYARPNATDAEIRHAAEVAEAHEFIDTLPDGYQTVVGLGGHSLSAGQRQRLTIARVVLADRPILLFDEATSSLDYETEAAVQRSLREATAGRTTIIVAHRLSTIRQADLIYVLDDGEVREQGQHDELLLADGIYASMWRVQTGEAIERRRPPAS
jgi:ATP-binding cassette, subfamily B, bacterial